jgi:hypothetical protein
MGGGGNNPDFWGRIGAYGLVYLFERSVPYLVMLAIAAAIYMVWA